MQHRSLQVAGIAGPPRIAVLRVEAAEPALAPAAASLWYAGDHVQVFRTARACCDREVPAEALVLDTVSADRALEWLREIRHDPRLAHRPAYLTSDLGADVLAASDGVVPAPTRLGIDLDAFNARCRALADLERLDEAGRLLAYLYTRPERLVEPLVDCRHATYYRYPLLDLFAPPGTAGAAWGDDLRRRGLLENARLVDRLRRCTGCGGSHLNYVDVCPECHAIDIGENIYFHCHTCGHVAPQDAFVTRNGLACGKCASKLRHIGVDYDRALECFGCHACSARFIEPEIEARCLQCGARSGTTELPESRIHSLRLTDAGRLAARQGRTTAAPATHDTQRNLTASFFDQTLNWMLQLRERHDDVQFAVAAVRVTNFDALAAGLGHSTALRLVEAFARRLREAIRTTDLITRAGEHAWYILSPQTDRPGLLSLLQSLEALAVASDQGGGRRIELAANCLTADEIVNPGAGAEALLATLVSGSRP
jgi:GGDEF domain-containing protein